MVLTTLGIKDFIPLLLIFAVICLLKTGALAALILGIKKLWQRIRKQ